MKNNKQQYLEKKQNDSKRGEIINLMLDKLSLEGQYLSESDPIQLKMKKEKRGGMPPINYFQFSVPLTTLFISILYKF